MISSINDPAYWGSRYIGAKRVADFNSEKMVASDDSRKATKIDYATRAEIAETLTEELGLESTSAQSDFSDVSANHPNADAIAAVTEAGIFSGNNGKFNPDGLLTRAQLAKVLVEAFDLERFYFGII